MICTTHYMHGFEWPFIVNNKLPAYVRRICNNYAFIGLKWLSFEIITYRSDTDRLTTTRPLYGFWSCFGLFMIISFSM